MSKTSDAPPWEAAAARVSAVRDYIPAVTAVRDYLKAEMDAASPAVVVAYCETNTGEVVELTLSDLVSTAHLAAWAIGEAK